MTTRTPTLGGLLALAIALAACSDRSTDGPAATSRSAPAPSPTATPTPRPAAACANLTATERIALVTVDTKFLGTARPSLSPVELPGDTRAAFPFERTDVPGPDQVFCARLTVAELRSVADGFRLCEVAVTGFGIDNPGFFPFVLHEGDVDWILNTGGRPHPFDVIAVCSRWHPRPGREPVIPASRPLEIELTMTTTSEDFCRYW